MPAAPRRSRGPVPGAGLVIALLRRYLPRYRWPLLLVIVLLFVQAVGTLYLPELNAEIINDGVVTGRHRLHPAHRARVMLAVLARCSWRPPSWASTSAPGWPWASGGTCAARIFRSVESFSQADVNHFGTATLITRNTNDVQQVQQVIADGPHDDDHGAHPDHRRAHHGPAPGRAALRPSSLVIIPILVAFIALVMSRAIPLFSALQRRTDHINLVTRETLTGIRVIRAFVRTRPRGAALRRRQPRLHGHGALAQPALRHHDARRSCSS